ncbi:unnamed protein product (macronuclear) [Paramecium tetraurelia]|uniref:CRC domain-containing protein n=1 Tax=Paramecium tetraurelia TaxID=5888 RepID=A0DF16_PARTE|nr:uncharacterized protein GSPATT00016459001 [Paramecium tetraurelia]CAK81633.1 unnamed protein product [Paramecium tetraurelia]|eukprot:XP_001449030.1 hypothetical protein (macronuclear) [Paramecium tetraurelia strain d4-2]
MNQDDHNSNEHKVEKQLHYYDQEWPQQPPSLSPRFTPQQCYLFPPQNMSNFNLHAEPEFQDKNKPKYPFRKLSAGDAPDEEDQFRQPYNHYYQQLPPQMKYPQNTPYMHMKYPVPYPHPWYRHPYPPFYYPPFDSSQYQNTLSKELQSKVNQLVQFQKVSPFQCNCKKSKCLKLYCECFANNWVCSQSCNCTECKNRIDNPNERSKAIEEALLRNPEAFSTILTNNGQQPQIIPEPKSQKEQSKETKKGCNCKKSECKKKYCECYSINQKCTDLCKCENCLNKEEPQEQIQPQKQENDPPAQQQLQKQDVMSKKDQKSKKIKKEEVQIKNNTKNQKRQRKN